MLNIQQENFNRIENNLVLEYNKDPPGKDGCKKKLPPYWTMIYLQMKHRKILNGLVWTIMIHNQKETDRVELDDMFDKQYESTMTVDDLENM